MSDSPNSLARPKVKVARLDKRIMYVIAAVALLLVVILIYAVQNSNKKETAQAQSTTAPITEADTRQPIQDPEQKSGLSMPPQSEKHEEERARPLSKSLVTVVRPEEPTELEKQRMKEEVELRAFRIENMKAALNSPLRAAAAIPEKKLPQTQIISTPNIEDIRSRHPLSISEASTMPSVQKDDQQAKEDFLNSRAGKDGSWQLPYERVPGKPFELKTGAVINGIMISGINSDLPGQILGQVSQNIYDTATGQHLLIPQGSRMIGVYDSRVAVGQSRVLVAWNRIIFPDGSSITLGIMPGTDVGGYGGYTGDVDNHYLRIFGSSAIMSMVSGGAAYAMDKFNKGSSSNNNPSLQDELGSSLSSQLGQSTLSLLQSNMSIKPAISTVPGKRFNMVVTKDIVFARPYTPYRS
ncbi:TrbI/VirB10 family protein [Desulfovibrio sp. JC010]|uniref:TrbI/VirB10 family protein n=1 Tax=Desulfovibrio sp. JC010 TaxID=2593641 RepID=UPI0013D0E3B5|nr:TrbI/VirB10 family protein [Desulfovibrio sp. JC010]NDV28906.1 conjugal transfer protein TrbI [Desulfovibrio sp. JC010]